MLYLERTPKRVRAVVSGETVADSVRAMLLHETGHQPVYYFPSTDVRADLLVQSDRHTHCPKKGEASYYSIRVGERVVENAAWYYPSLVAGAPEELTGAVAFYWDRVDAWFEEDEEVFVHPRDPYHRVDVLASARQVRVRLDGELLAETRRALALFETGLPVRWYIPRADVLASLTESDTVTRCPYKGTARYYSADGEGDLIWCYERPFAEVGRIAGLLAFWNERVDLELDGVAQERPESPWSHRSRVSV